MNVIAQHVEEGGSWMKQKSKLELLMKAYRIQKEKKKNEKVAAVPRSV
jgi:hypothetical protein